MDSRVKRVENAQISKAQISTAQISEAQISTAQISKAQISTAQISKAQISTAQISKAQISTAQISKAQISKAQISNGANLEGANLDGANLEGANLEGANLEGANLGNWRNLEGANLEGAKNLEMADAITRILPDGDLIGYKKCNDNVIITLQIPAGAKRSNSTGRKCRAEYALVLRVEGAEFGVTDSHGPRTEYRLDQMVHCDHWDDNRWNECSGGIHFFITRWEAENY